MRLCELLKIEKGVTSIIGSGGKTTLMLTLARELEKQGRVIVTTTTHIKAPEGIPLYDRLQPFFESCACFGRRNEEGKLSATEGGIEPMLPLADYILVEADGSKRLPIKAHASHEPVIPACTNKVILVVGASGFLQPVKRVVHRIEPFCSLTGLSEDELVTPEAVAEVIKKEALCDCVFINQVDNDEMRELAKLLCRRLDLPVYAGALNKEEWECLS
ncbi:MAG: selenium cofactor biosynthesis protein YqeC [Clostridia bacterium]|nr:selenium cofactor biosynthesis protein YqeC [Clostridia bacterium]